MLYVDHPFSEKFCSSLVDECLEAIALRGSVNLVAMPGVGVTFFVRHLAYRSPDAFIAVNSFEMHDFSKSALYGQLAHKLGLVSSNGDVDLRAIGRELRARADKGKKVVLVFNRFDRLGPILDQGFYENLRFLRDAAHGQLAMLFVTAEPVTEFSGQGIQELMRLVGSVLYFRGYSSGELREIITSSDEHDIEPKALELSGGHHALLQILARCQNLDNALSDPMVELIIKDMYLGLSPRRQKTIELVASGRSKVIDPFLVNVGYVVDPGGKPKTFTPLLAEYALRQSQAHLPARERRLLEILKVNAGQIVSKQDIFDIVWAEKDGVASDWALNALVYRLRRHTAFDSQRYSIESYKKQGYVLHDHQV